MNDGRNAATSQLNLVLGFFVRVESRLALMLGVDLSMLAFLASHAPPASELGARYYLALVPVFFIAGSLVHVWLGFFPKLDGPKQSLVYFGTLSARPESEYIAAFRALSDDEYISDLLSQTWHNARILTEKFVHLKLAFRWMLFAILPWLYVLGMFTAANVAATGLLPRR